MNSFQSHDALNLSITQNNTLKQVMFSSYWLLVTVVGQAIAQGKQHL